MLLVSVRAAKVGVAVELMFWTVLTAPELTVKLVELKDAIPFVPVLASATEMAPAAETETGLVPDTAMVPEALGIWIVLAAVGVTKSTVVLFDPLVPNMKDVPT